MVPVLVVPLEEEVGVQEELRNPQKAVQRTEKAPFQAGVGASYAVAGEASVEPMVVPAHSCCC